MRNYLILREKVRAFRADPEVQEALRLARVDQLARADAGRGRDPRPTCARRRSTPTSTPSAGMGFERLDQLALEHLYGVR